MNRKGIIEEAIDIISNKFLLAESDEEVYNLLEKYELDDLIRKYVIDDLVPRNYSNFFETQKTGKILLFGDCHPKKNIINACLKSLGIDIKRFEHVPYEEIVNYNFKKLEYNSNYRLILIGPMPHSARGMGDNSSILEWLVNNENVAKTIKLDNLKITKTSFKNAIKSHIESGYLSMG